jgi:hypothetical protein
MQYYVINPDGQKYGPADVATLSSWAAQNRLNPTSQLEEVGTGRIITANQLPGLVFGTTVGTAGTPGAPNYANPPAAGPVGGYNPGYQAPVQSQNLTYAWVCFGLSFCCCGPISAGLGIMYAGKAIQDGHPGGNAAKIANIIMLVLSIIGVIANVALRLSGVGQR